MVLIGGQPIRGMGGETLGAVVVMHDLTEHNRLEQQTAPGPEDGSDRPAGGRSRATISTTC